MPLSPKDLEARDAKRDLGAELLEAVDDMLAGRAAAGRDAVLAVKEDW